MFLCLCAGKPLGRDYFGILPDGYYYHRQRRKSLTEVTNEWKAFQAADAVKGPAARAGGPRAPAAGLPGARRGRSPRVLQHGSAVHGRGAAAERPLRRSARCRCNLFLEPCRTVDVNPLAEPYRNWRTARCALSRELRVHEMRANDQL